MSLPWSKMFLRFQSWYLAINDVIIKLAKPSSKCAYVFIKKIQGHLKPAFEVSTNKSLIGFPRHIIEKNALLPTKMIQYNSMPK